MKNKFYKFTIILFIFVGLSSFLNAEEINLNAIKFTFLSWTSGSTKISYERAFPYVKQSAELCVGLICAGYDKYQNNPLGFTLRYGHKFFVGKYDEQKAFDGFFLRPEIIYSQFSYDAQNTQIRSLARMTSLIGTFGYQKTFGNFIIDGWIGGGVAFGNPCDTGYHHGFQLWNWFNTYNEHIALSFSIRLGWCF